MILVHSPKGGCGSTTVAANLALMLARKGQDITLLDLTGQGMLGICLGGTPDDADPVRSSADRQPVILAGVRVVSLNHNRTPAEILDEIARYAAPGHLLVADLPPDNHALLAQLLPNAFFHICVLAPEPAVIPLLPRALARWSPAAVETCHFVLNRIDFRLRLSRDISGLFDELLGRKLLATIRRDEAINEAAAMMEPLDRFAPGSAALADFEILADRIAPLLGHEAGHAAI